MKIYFLLTLVSLFVVLSYMPVAARRGKSSDSLDRHSELFAQGYRTATAATAAIKPRRRRQRKASEKNNKIFGARSHTGRNHLPAPGRWRW